MKTLEPAAMFMPPEPQPDRSVALSRRATGQEQDNMRSADLQRIGLAIAILALSAGSTVVGLRAALSVVLAHADSARRMIVLALG